MKHRTWFTLAALIALSAPARVLAQDVQKEGTEVKEGKPCTKDGDCGSDSLCQDHGFFLKDLKCTPVEAPAGALCGSRSTPPFCEAGYVCKKEQFWDLEAKCMKGSAEEVKRESTHSEAFLKKRATAAKKKKKKKKKKKNDK